MIILHRYIKRGIALLTAVAVAGGGFYAYKKISGSKSTQSMRGMGGSSLVYAAQKGDIINTITATGTVMLNNEVEVYAEGEVNKVQEFHVEEGDSVKAGQLLVTYDTDDSVEELENKIRDTQRDIENAELTLKSLQLPAADSEIQKLENEVSNNEKSLSEAQSSIITLQNDIKQQNTEIANAKADLEKAEKTVSDNAKLLDVGGITQDEYDTSVTELDKSKATYDKALDSLTSLNISLENAQKSVVSAENTLALSRTTLEETQNKLNLEENKIKIEQQKLTLAGLRDTLSDAQKDLNDIVYSTYSSVDGVVTEVCIDEGTYTEENTVMLKVADLNDLIVSANIEEYDAPLLALGQKVTMTSDGLEGRTYTGEITKINITASSASSNMGTETVVPVEISVDNPDGVLKQNYNLDLEIEIANSSGVLCVPSAAVGADGRTGESYVYKIENDVLAKTAVETGETNDTLTQIVTGLNEGDNVIASVSSDLQDGMSLDEVKAKKMQSSTDNANSKEGTGNDRNKGTEQMLPSGNFGGHGTGGGMPPGGGR